MNKEKLLNKLCIYLVDSNVVVTAKKPYDNYYKKLTPKDPHRFYNFIIKCPYVNLNVEIQYDKKYNDINVNRLSFIKNRVTYFGYYTITDTVEDILSFIHKHKIDFLREFEYRSIENV